MRCRAYGATRGCRHKSWKAHNLERAGWKPILLYPHFWLFRQQLLRWFPAVRQCWLCLSEAFDTCLSPSGCFRWSRVSVCSVRWSVVGIVHGLLLRGWHRGVQNCRIYRLAGDSVPGSVAEIVFVRTLLSRGQTTSHSVWCCCCVRWVVAWFSEPMPVSRHWFQH